MAEQIIRDFYGKIIAKIETKPNGDKTIRDFYGRILGKYDSATNTTRDFYGRVVAKGECLTMLIESKQKPIPCAADNCAGGLKKIMFCGIINFEAKSIFFSRGFDENIIKEVKRDIVK